MNDPSHKAPTEPPESPAARTDASNTNHVAKPDADSVEHFDAVKYLTTLIVIFFVIVVDGFVVMTLWRWFAVPMGARSMPLGTGMGAALVPLYFRMRRKSADGPVEGDPVRAALKPLLRSVLTALWVLGFALLARKLT